MSNTTDLNTIFLNYTTNDLELVNLIQSGCSLVCTLIILAKLSNPMAFFGSVRKKQLEAKRNKQKRELERLETLIRNIKNNDDVNIDSLLSEDNEDSETKQEIPMASKKKKRNLESRV